MSYQILRRKFISLLIREIQRLLNRIRIFKIKLLNPGIKIGRNVSIGSGVVIRMTDSAKIEIKDNVAIEKNAYIYSKGGSIAIGANVFIGTGSQIVAVDSVIIGDDCLVAAYCIIRDQNHGYASNIIVRKQELLSSPIVIGNDVWLGVHSVVVAGNKIGEGVIVGANAVVTKNVSAFSVVGGVPAKYLKKREK